jgi:two-component system response regulator
MMAPELPDTLAMDDRLVEILLVEDSPSDIQLTLHALERNNLANRIHVVRDGAPRNPRVVLLDLKLPLIDGLEVLRRMKAEPRTRTIPVVVLTSSREERDIVETYQLGVNSYIVKPVDFEQFTESVRQLGLYWALLNQPPSA